MPCVQIAFRRRPKDFIGRMLNLFTGIKGFSHVELVFSDGLAFSSTSLEGGQGGCRFGRIPGLNDTSKWICVPVECSEGQEEAMRDEAEYLARIKARYDFAGCVDVVLPFVEQNPDDWFCSEVVEHLLQLADLSKTGAIPEDCTPNSMAADYGAIAKMKNLGL
jgi:hypothetical protein